eukprot:SAG11_NODE_9897_length_871_cov_1.648964_1_plen_128_part_00
MLLNLVLLRLLDHVAKACESVARSTTPSTTRSQTCRDSDADDGDCDDDGDVGQAAAAATVSAPAAAAAPPSVAEQHAFLDAAKAYDFATVRALLDQNPAYANVQVRPRRPRRRLRPPATGLSLCSYR